MEFHDPDRPRDEAEDLERIERGPEPDRRPWILVVVGVVLYAVMQLVQMRSFGPMGTDPLQYVLVAVSGLVFLVATALATAGIVLLALRRWLFHDLAEALSGVDTDQAGHRPDGGAPPVR